MKYIPTKYIGEPVEILEDKGKYLILKDEKSNLFLYDKIRFGKEFKIAEKIPVDGSVVEVRNGLDEQLKIRVSTGELSENGCLICYHIDHISKKYNDTTRWKYWNLFFQPEQK